MADQQQQQQGGGSKRGNNGNNVIIDETMNNIQQLAVADKEAKRLVRLVSDHGLNQFSPQQLVYALEIVAPNNALGNFLLLNEVLLRQQSQQANFDLQIEQRIVGFCHDVDVQLLSKFDCLRDYLYMVRWVSELTIANNNPKAAMSFVWQAMLKLKVPTDVFCSLQTDVLFAAIQGKLYKLGCSFVDQYQPMSVELRKFPVIATLDLIKYFYYAGILYIGCDRFRDAIRMFKICIALPTNGLSMAIVGAFKKLTLVSLLVNGRAEPVGKHTSAVVYRNLQKVCPEYREFADLYADKATSINSLQRCGENIARSVHLNDGNLGLLKQCIEAFQIMKIASLGKAYISLPMESIITRVGLDATKYNFSRVQKMVEQMILDRKANATIDQSTGIVHFHSSSPDEHLGWDSETTMEALNERIKQVSMLSTLIADVEDDIITSQDYNRRALEKENERRDHGFGGGNSSSSSNNNNAGGIDMRFVSDYAMDED